MLMYGGNWLLHITGNLLGLQGYASNLTGCNHRVATFPMERASSIIQTICSRKLSLQKGKDESDEV